MNKHFRVSNSRVEVIGWVDFSFHNFGLGLKTKTYRNCFRLILSFLFFEAAITFYSQKVPF